MGSDVIWADLIMSVACKKLEIFIYSVDSNEKTNGTMWNFLAIRGCYIAFNLFNAALVLCKIVKDVTSKKLIVFS